MKSRYLSLVLGFVCALGLAAPTAAESVPGDACSPDDIVGLAGGAETAGKGYYMVCQGGVWVRMLETDTAGNVGVGQDAPKAPLHVGGEVIVGAGTGLACDADRTGALRYSADNECIELCDGTSGWACITPVPCADSTPDAYNFTDLINQTASTQVNSDILQINGLGTDCTVTLLVFGDGSPQYRTCSAADCSAVIQDWTSGFSLIGNGEYVQLRLTTSAIGGKTHTATLAVGNGSDTWNATVEGDDCTGSPPPGTICADGTVYAAESPDDGTFAETSMFTTPDSAPSGYSWGIDGETYTDDVSGVVNTARLKDFGTSFPAAVYCADLSAHGHDDWYLPSRQELSAFAANSDAIGGTADDHWSSSQKSSVNNAWMIRFSNSSNFDKGRSDTFDVRCVRRGYTGTSNCTNPAGGTINHGDYAILYETDEATTGTGCVGEARVCLDGNLSGSYTEGSCAIADCSVTLTPGCQNADGSIYVGETPDTGTFTEQSMFTTPASAPTTYVWGLYGTDAIPRDDNAGFTNTVLLETYGTSAPAADYCLNLSAHGYDDWYLPAYNELILLYDRLSDIGTGGSSTDWHFSSTEDNDNNDAMGKRMIDGAGDDISKNGSYPVRCVRRGTAGSSDCANPAGGTIDHGDYATLYQSATATVGEGCQSEARICLDGELSGSYTEGSCAIIDCDDTLTPGCQRDDGTIYAGDTPDGAVPMYTTPDSAPSTYQWGSSGTARGTTDTNTGATNTATLAPFGASATTGHPAAYYCDDLSAHGHTDWYLPAYNEIAEMTNHYPKLGGDTDYQWSSTENTTTTAYRVSLASGDIDSQGKTTVEHFRCVRVD